MRYAVVALMACLGVVGPACADPQALPWTTFSQATAYLVNADLVACPGSPTEPVARATFRYAGDRYAYMAKDGRWVLWRLRPHDLPGGASLPDYIWFGDQGPESQDMMRVVNDMTYQEAQLYFRGPCSWLDVEKML